MELLERIAHLQTLPKWKFLGLRTDNYERQYFVFFGADTIQQTARFTDVVVAYTQYQKGYGFPSSPEAFISALQEGQRRQEAVVIAHIDCAAERIEGFSEAKMFEDQLVTYVCAHNSPKKAEGRPTR